MQNASRNIPVFALILNSPVDIWVRIGLQVDKVNKINGASNTTENLVSPEGEVWQEKDLFLL